MEKSTNAKKTVGAFSACPSRLLSHASFTQDGLPALSA